MYFADPRCRRRYRQFVLFDDKNIYMQTRTLDVNNSNLSGYLLDHRGDRKYHTPVSPSCFVEESTCSQ